MPSKPPARIPKKDVRYGKVYIYALKDPETNRVFYVGRTKRSPETRLLGHLAEVEQYQRENENLLAKLLGFKVVGSVSDKAEGNVKKIKWILEIRRRGLEPRIEVLDIGDFEIEQDAARLEEAWIAEMRMRKQPLTNYIYSRRMNPSWYGETNPGYKPGWARTPMEYIERLKAGKVGGAKTKTNKSRAYTLPQLRRLSKKAHKISRIKKSKD